MKHQHPEPKYVGLYAACNVNQIPTPSELKGIDPMPEATDSSLATQHHGALAPNRDAAGMTHPEPASIATVIQAAIEKGMDAASLEKLVGLYERVSDRDAAKECNASLARFQNNCPSIKKTSTAKITTKSGAQYGYDFAELDEIARTIREPLAREGLSYTWDSSVAENTVICTCTVRHINGHTFTATFGAPRDTEAKMSGAQMSAAALTYARRQSLVQALGLTTCDADTDGAAVGAGAGTISDHQAANLAALILDVGADTDKTLRAYGVSKIADLPAVNYSGICAALEAKRKATK